MRNREGNVMHSLGDVIAAREELTGIGNATGEQVKLVTAILYDLTDQAQNVEIIFMNVTGSIGAESATYAPDDTVAQTIVGTHTFTLHSDANTSNIFVEPNLGLAMKTGVAGSLWAGLVCREGTPSYAAGGLVVSLVFEQYGV